MRIPEGRILTISEVAERTRTKEATLRFWRHLDDGSGPPSFKLGRRVVYMESDVDAWIEAQYSRGSGLTSDAPLPQFHVESPQSQEAILAHLIDNLRPLNWTASGADELARALLRTGQVTVTEAPRTSKSSGRPSPTETTTEEARNV